MQGRPDAAILSSFLVVAGHEQSDGGALVACSTRATDTVDVRVEVILGRREVKLNHLGYICHI